MTLTFSEFISGFFSNPALAITALLTIGVILVNGWTDAPNAIATCVATRALRPKTAVIMAALGNFLGVFVMTQINSTVAQTIYKMVDFGGDAHEAMIALCAALFAIVTWATAAWIFAIPTSESHALIAGLSGAAIALHNSFAGINPQEWLKVIYGIGLSTVMGFGLGWLTAKVGQIICRNMDRRKTNRFFRLAEATGGAASAFMHGAQDGQKFMSIFLLGMFLVKGQGNVTTFEIPTWLMILCSIIMGAGTAMGGKKIIKSVGMDMVKLEKHQGFSADLASAVSLVFCSVFGLPVSTTHVKTTSIMGVGAVKRVSAINFGVVKEMVMTWILTFPGCGLLSFLVTKLFLLIFN